MNMSKQQSWEQFKKYYFEFPKLGLAVDLSRMNVSDEFFATMDLPMWDWLGGRTSEMSAVGLLPAALQGIDIHGLLAGARACDDVTRASQDSRRIHPIAGNG